MPDFTFTSPEGKNYTVTGPEGATKEQAFEVLQKQLSSGTAKEDTTQAQKPALTKEERFKNIVQSENPLEKAKKLEQPEARPPQTLKGSLGAIGTSTALGAAVGALSPEIVTGLGIAASFIPVVDVAAPALLATGQAMRAGRLGAIGFGAASGLTSETAGQVAEAAGAGKGTAAAARLVGGGVPNVAAEAASVTSKFVPTALKTAWKAVQSIAGYEPDAAKAVQVAKENMAKMGEAGQPQTAMHAMLQKGVETDRQAAEKAANDVMTKAHADAAKLAQTDAAAATKLVDDAKVRADQIRQESAKRANVLEKASDNKLSTATKVLAQAQPELNKVGQVTELSDIGNTLRTAAIETQGAKIAARNTTYKELQTKRDAIVNEKEAAGKTIDLMPEMKELRAEIGKYTLSNEKGRAAAKGLARATDPGVRRAYESVEEAIRNRRVQVGTDPDTGAPKFQTFKTSFEAIDAVRRRLGDALAGGADAEGYSALGKGIAGKLYDRLSKIQEAFVGKDAAGRNIQRELQSGYAEGTEGLKGFGTGAGKRLTATDRVDPERFNADPKTLPKYFFNSQQSVRDAKELTGNPVLVEQQAANYTARSMQGMSAKQAKNWIQENSDWMREIPGLQKNATAYASKLEQIERINDKLGKRAAATAKESEIARVKGLESAEKERQAGIEEASKAARGSAETQKRLQEEGSKAANAAQETAFAPAKKLEDILKSGEAPEAVNKLLTSGKPEQTRLASSYLASQPGGQKVLEASVRQVMRNMNENTLRSEWTNRLRPMLDNGKMIPPERLAVLEKDVNRILDSYKGKDKTSLVQRHIAAALATAANVGVGAVRQ